MTVIAYKDGVLAADKRASLDSLHATVTKVWQHPGKLIAGCGSGSALRQVVEWIKGGAVGSMWPQPKDDACEVIVINHEKAGKPRIEVYYNGPFPMLPEDDCFAMGEGASIALAAMHLGRSAIEGVELACKLCPSCGNGVDSISFEVMP